MCSTRHSHWPIAADHPCPSIHCWKDRVCCDLYCREMPDSRQIYVPYKNDVMRLLYDEPLTFQSWTFSLSISRRGHTTLARVKRKRGEREIKLVGKASTEVAIGQKGKWHDHQIGMKVDQFCEYRRSQQSCPQGLIITPQLQLGNLIVGGLMSLFVTFMFASLDWFHCGTTHWQTTYLNVWCLHPRLLVVDFFSFRSSSFSCRTSIRTQNSNSLWVTAEVCLAGE